MMKDEETFGCHPKIYHYGDSHTYGIYSEGFIEIQEKIDGSQISWKIDQDYRIRIRSKGKEINKDDPRDGWGPAVAFLRSRIDTMIVGVQYFGEYLSKPKHNCLKYDRVPRNHIVLFGVKEKGGGWFNHEQLSNEGEIMDLEVAPLLGEFTGAISDAQVQSFIGTPSFLGGCNKEGVVIKNLSKGIFAKLVDPKFKEIIKSSRKVKQRHTPEDVLLELTKMLTTEARWNKAYQYLRDNGEITHTTKDIGPIVKRIHEDLLYEEQEFIKNYLFNVFGKNIFKNSVKNVHQWYKDKLIEMREDQHES